jgi:calpain-15
VQPEAIKQGSVGDCWYLASLSALSEEPSRIKALFENTEYPENGAFAINFWIGGKKQ